MSNETTPVHTPRYALDRERIGLVADATGNWVQVTDYWTVEDERDRLLATTAKLRELLEGARRFVHLAAVRNPDLCVASSLLTEIDAALPTPSVKP